MNWLKNNLWGPGATIKKFIAKAEGLILDESHGLGQVSFSQRSDKKRFTFSLSEVEEVLKRQDNQGIHFLQINFKSQKQVLITNKFVGFRPIIAPHSVEILSDQKIPRVVTTFDLLSVVEALEESLQKGLSWDSELFKQIFEAIIAGGEDVGFDFTEERLWVKRLHHPPASSM